MEDKKHKMTSDSVEKKIKPKKSLFRKLFKWFFSIILILIVFLLLFISSTIMFINTDWGNNFVVKNVNPILNGSISVKHFYIYPFLGRFAAKKLEIYDKQGISIIGPLSLKIEWDNRMLFKKKLLIRNFNLTCKNLNGIQRKNGEINLVSAFVNSTIEKTVPEKETSSSSKFPFDVEIKKINLTLSSLNWKSGLMPVSDVSLKDLKISANFLLSAGKGIFTLSTGKTTVHLKEKGLLSLSHIVIDTTMNKFNLNIKTFKLRTYQSYFSIRGEIPDILNPISANLLAQVGVSLKEANDFFRFTPKKCMGKLSLQARTDGELKNPLAELHLSLNDFTLFDVSAGNFKLNIEAKKDYKINLAGKLAYDPKNNLELKGDVQLFNGWTGFDEEKKPDYSKIKHKLNLNINFENTNWLTKLAEIKLPFLANLVKVNMDWHGEGDELTNLKGDLTAKGEFTISKDKETTKVTHFIDLTGKIQNNEISGHLEEKVRPWVISAKKYNPSISPKYGKVFFRTRTDARYNISKGDAIFFGDVSCNNISLLTRVFGIEDIYGKSNLKVSGKIHNNELTANLHVSAENIKYSGVELASVELPLTVKNSQLAIPTALFRTSDSTIILDAKLNLFQPHSMKIRKRMNFSAQLGAKEVSISDFYKAAGISACVNIDAQLGGDLFNPEGYIDLAASNILSPYQELNKLRLNASISNKEVIVSDIKINFSKDEELSAYAYYNLAGKYAFNLISNEISFASINSLKDISDINGKISIDANGYGSVSKPAFNGKIVLSDFKIKSEMFPDLAVKVAMKGDRITSSLKSQDNSLTGKVDLNISRKVADSELKFSNPPFNEILEMFDLPVHFSSLKGKLTAIVPIDKWALTEADIELNSIDFTYNDIKIKSLKPIKLSTMDGLAIIHNFNVSVADYPWKLTGTTNLKKERSTLTLFGKLDLSKLHSLVPEMPVSTGLIDVNVLVKGKWIEPDINADISLKSIGMEIPGLENTLKNVNGKIKVKNNIVKISKLKGNIDDGTFNVGGTLNLKNFTPDSFSFSIQGDLIPVFVPKVADARFNLKAYLKGNLKRSSLNGVINIENALYYQNISLNPLQILQEPEISVQSEPVMKEESMLDTMALNIAVRSSSPIVVNNNLANLNLLSDLKIVGTAAQPIVKGRVQTDKGKVFFQKTTFNIDNCIIDFVDPYKIDPEITITATSHKKDTISKITYDIALKVSGKTESLDFKLSAKPFLEHSDILSLLLMNTTRPFGNGASFSPKTLLAKYLSEKYGEKLKDTTGLDFLEVNNSKNSSGQDTTNVAVGKQLSKRMIVKYAIENNEDELINKVIAQYILLENLYFIYSYGSNGISDGEIKWRLDF